MTERLPTTESELARYFGRRGGLSRAKALSPERRSEIARKAQRASVKARRAKKKAKARKDLEEK